MAYSPQTLNDAPGGSLPALSNAALLQHYDELMRLAHGAGAHGRGYGFLANTVRAEILTRMRPEVPRP